MLVSGILMCAGGATPAKQTYKVYGAGAVSCGAWLSDPSLQQSRLSWILGFVSGAGWHGASLKDTDSDGIKQWIDTYCKDHPLDKLSLATAGVVEALDKK